MAGAGQDDPADVREGALQGVDRPPGAEVVGAVDQQDRDLEGLAGAEQLVARGAVAVSPSRPASLPKVSQKPGPPWQRTSGSPVPDRVVHSRQPSSVTTISSTRRF